MTMAFNIVFLFCLICVFSEGQEIENVRVKTRYGYWMMQNTSDGQLIPNIPSFQIDETTRTFLLDGQPFRYISGSIHYFRIPRTYWLDRLKRVRALGFNAIYYYIPWNVHETYEGRYNFSGSNDFVEFSRIAEKLGLYTILRIGPYVCGEWENGGIPYWVLKKNVTKLRSYDPVYTAAVSNWFSQLLPRITPLLRKNGGPILMLQIENEYGSYDACDKPYLRFLRDLTRKHVGDGVLLFTTDGSADGLLKCGTVEEVLTTVDFGPTDNRTQIEEYFKLQRKYDPTAPIVNSEYYPGWLVLWGQTSQSLPSIQTILNGAQTIYELGGNVNFYMIHGGTNFGFWNGAETEAPCITSYDYTAPITEAGDITQNYLEIRKWIKNLVNWPNPPLDVPKNNLKKGYGKIKLKLVHESDTSKPKPKPKPMMCEDSESPLSFEQMDQPMGLVSYHTEIEGCDGGGDRNLTISEFGDFAYVFVNFKYYGTLTRRYYNISTNSLLLDSSASGTLTILVESQGRKTFETIIDHKGILSDVYLDDQKLTGWSNCAIDLPNFSSFFSMQNQKQGVFQGLFQIAGKPADTWLDTTGWGKGIAIINSINIGRYWPTAGPQMTLYIPKEFLKTGSNSVHFIELQGAETACSSNTSCVAELIDHPIFKFE